MSEATRLQLQRKYCNQQIVRLLEIATETMPELRFHQLLWALNLTERAGENIKDKFYEESRETLKNLQSCLNSTKSEEESETKS